MSKVLKAGVFSAVLLSTACSSIISKSDYPVSIKSEPPGASFTVTNKAGQAIHSGVTPQTVTLKSSAGYFKGETYVIKMRSDGFESSEYTLNSSLDGWYFGNILLGGLLGMLIVDPATGAMYNLPVDVDVPLAKSAIAAEQVVPDLKVGSMDDLTEGQKAKLEKL